MSDQIPLPQPGDTYYQKAIILNTDRKSQSLIQLHVSDQHGDIGGEICEERTVAIFENNFKEQFAPTDETSIFIRSVEIESCDPDANEITLYRLNTEGKRILPVSTHKEKLDKFLKTHFKSQNQPD